MRTKRSSTGLSIARTVTVPLPDGAALTVGYRFASENAARHRPLLDRLHRTGDRRLVERIALDLIRDWDITRDGRALPVNGKGWQACAGVSSTGLTKVCPPSQRQGLAGVRR